MKKIIYILPLIAILCSSCLSMGADKLENSSEKELQSIDYTYRFLYNDTIKKGTPNEDIQNGRVCEVLFKKELTKNEVEGIQTFTTVISHNESSIMKAGPTGSVTNKMLYDMFKKHIERDGLSKLWVYVSISDASSIKPLNNSPKLGMAGDFSEDRVYRVTAANNSTQDYKIVTIKGF